MNCKLCDRPLDRPLDRPEDPLSTDCGGDCWGCIGGIEAALGDPRSLDRVRAEAALGLRPGWTDPTTDRHRPDTA